MGAANKISGNKILGFTVMKKINPKKKETKNQEKKFRKYEVKSETFLKKKDFSSMHLHIEYSPR